MQASTNFGIIITVIACLFTIIGTMIGLFLYLASKIDGVRSEMYGMRQDINAEMKDFHGRLCTIEERKK